MAGIRMSGLISNMDTESVVKAMMDAHRLKLTKIENKKTVLEWKQDKWKDLNTKLYKLYQEQTSKLRLTSNYNVNKATSANESVVKVTADKNAATGSHSIAVKQLASTQYVTGGKLSSTATANTKLTDLGIMEGTNLTISAKDGSKTQVLSVKAGTTINDLVKSCKDAGLNASFDEKQQRLFISSSTSGSDQSFSITSDTSSVTIPGIAADKQGEAKQIMNDLLANKDAISSLNSTEKAKFYENALKEDHTGMTTSQISFAQDYKKLYDYTKENVIANTQTSADIKAEVVVRDAIKAAIYADPATGTATITDELGKSYSISGIKSLSELESFTETEEKAIDDVIEQYLAGTLSDADMVAKFDAYEIKEKMLEENPDINFNDSSAKDEMRKRIKDQYKAELITDKVNEEVNRVMEDAVNNQSGETGKALLGYRDSVINKAIETANKDLINNIQGVINSNGAGLSGNVLDCLGLGTAATKIPASDCVVIYNGVELTSSSNTLSVNGLTFEAVSVSEKDDKGNYKSTSLTVSKDTQGVYDMVKGFLTQYNSILKDMNTLYYADSAKGYNPLTDEEKEAMSDEQIKLWEDKIKDSSLRRDSTLGGITSAMKNAMASTIELEIDGEKKKYSLSSFGIMTSKDYTEKGLLHIYGDKDDATYSDKNDKLMKAIEEDPDTFIKVMTGITENLHTAMNKKMSKTSLSSALTFYNDKQITDQLTQYKKDISKMESKLEEKEAAYYKQFTAMEKALASLQEQQSALSGLLGTS